MAKKTKPYHRVMLKLSGEFFESEKGEGIEAKALMQTAKEVITVQKKGMEVVVVCGGGNIWRYRDTKEAGIERTTSDYMGMLATIMNAVALQSTIEKLGVSCRVVTALDMPQLAERYIRGKAIRHLEKGRIVICAGGTGNPYFTTDTAAALRAVELGCDVLLKATKVDGVYTADPTEDQFAKKYDTLSYDEAIEKRLKVMDQTAFSMCREAKLPIVVFNRFKKDAIVNAARGKSDGTIVK